MDTYNQLRTVLVELDAVDIHTLTPTRAARIDQARHLILNFNIRCSLCPFWFNYDMFEHHWEFAHPGGNHEGNHGVDDGINMDDLLIDNNIMDNNNNGVGGNNGGVNGEGDQLLGEGAPIVQQPNQILFGEGAPIVQQPNQIQVGEGAPIVQQPNQIQDNNNNGVVGNNGGVIGAENQQGAPQYRFPCPLCASYNGHLLHMRTHWDEHDNGRCMICNFAGYSTFRRFMIHVKRDHLPAAA